MMSRTQAEAAERAWRADPTPDPPPEPTHDPGVVIHPVPQPTPETP